MSNFNYQTAYRRNLPHLQPPGATFFLTFRLAGSLPQEVISQFKREKQWLEHLALKNPNCHKVKENFERVRFNKFEMLLDGESIGPVWLKDQGVASIIAESLHHRDGKRLPIGCVYNNGKSCTYGYQAVAQVSRSRHE